MEIMGKVVNAEDLKAWIDAHAVKATEPGVKPEAAALV